MSKVHQLSDKFHFVGNWYCIIKCQLHIAIAKLYPPRWQHKYLYKFRWRFIFESVWLCVALYAGLVWIYAKNKTPCCFSWVCHCMPPPNRTGLVTECLVLLGRALVSVNEMPPQVLCKYTHPPHTSLHRASTNIHRLQTAEEFSLSLSLSLSVILIICSVRCRQSRSRRGGLRVVFYPPAIGVQNDTYLQICTTCVYFCDSQQCQSKTWYGPRYHAGSLLWWNQIIFTTHNKLYYLWWGLLRHPTEIQHWF